MSRCAGNCTLFSRPGGGGSTDLGKLPRFFLNYRTYRRHCSLIRFVQYLSPISFSGSFLMRIRWPAELSKEVKRSEAALWIRTGFSADPNPFYISADLGPDSDPGAKPMRIRIMVGL
jgi:hypothetical protein